MIIKIRKISNKIKSIKESIGFFKKKKEKLQKTFRIKLTPNNIANFGFCFFEDFVHTKNNERANKKKRIFQTTGKTQFGGVIDGLIDKYQSLLTFEEVKMLPINAKK
jgi:hypothetical protein